MGLSALLYHALYTKRNITLTNPRKIFREPLLVGHASLVAKRFGRSATFSNTFCVDLKCEKVKQPLKALNTVTVVTLEQTKTNKPTKKKK